MDFITYQSLECTNITYWCNSTSNYYNLLHAVVFPLPVCASSAVLQMDHYHLFFHHYSWLFHLSLLTTLNKSNFWVWNARWWNRVRRGYNGWRISWGEAERVWFHKAEQTSNKWTGDPRTLKAAETVEWSSIVKTWKQPTCPQRGIDKKLWYIYYTEYYLAFKKNFLCAYYTSKSLYANVCFLT